jgi:peptidoglycan/LPS O-acetylase OafA/YrhL
MLLGLGALYARYEAKIAPILAEIPAVISLAALAFAGVWTLLDPSLFQVVSALLVAPCVFIGVFALPQRSAPTRWLLGSWPLRTIGLYSYTLYLWQQLALTKAAWNVGVVPVLGLVGACAFSVLSYHTVEAACRRIARAIKPRTVAVSTPLP